MISIVMPALNEERQLAKTVEKVMACAAAEGMTTFEVIIVDDGSTDGTPLIIEELLKKYPTIRSLRHPTNLGLGKSFLDGVQIARFPKVTILPSDNYHASSFIRQVFRNLDVADVSIGFTYNTEMRGTFRHAVHLIYNLIFLMTFGIHLRDIHGLPIYSTEALKKLQFISTRYGLFAEINVKLLRQGASYSEFGGWISNDPAAQKSAAMRPKAVFEAVKSYLLLIYEVNVQHKKQFSFTPKRVRDPNSHEA